MRDCRRHQIEHLVVCFQGCVILDPAYVAADKHAALTVVKGKLLHADLKQCLLLSASLAAHHRRGLASEVHIGALVLFHQ